MAQHHLARVVQRQVERLDQDVLAQAYAGSGDKPYDPSKMLAMFLYLILRGNHSPASWHRQARENQVVAWLGCGYQPSRSACYDFRDRMGSIIDQLNADLVAQADRQGHLDPQIGVQDGTTFRSAASRHRMVNDKTLQKRIEVLQAVLDQEQFPSEPLPAWVPSTHAGRLNLLGRMHLAKEILAERLAKNAKKPKDKRKDPDKVLVSLTDPVAPLGRDKEKIYGPIYTVQYVVAPQSHLIMTYQCEASVTDSGTLTPMLDAMKRQFGGRFKTMLADAAYCSILDLRDCQQRQVELFAPVQANSFSKPKQSTNGVGVSNREAFQWLAETKTYRCPAGHLLDYVGKQKKSRVGDRELTQHRFHCSSRHCVDCPLAPGCVKKAARGRTVTRMEGQELLDEQKLKMETEEAKSLYRLRGQTVERGFGDAKGNRRFTRFHGRGLKRVRAEIGLLVLAQNIQRLDRLQNEAVNSRDHET